MNNNASIDNYTEEWLEFSKALFMLPDANLHFGRHNYYRLFLVRHAIGENGVAPTNLYNDQNGNRLREVRILFESARVEYTWENADGLPSAYSCPITSLSRLRDIPDPPPISDNTWKALQIGALNLCRFLDRKLQDWISAGAIEIAGRLYDELAPITPIPPDVWSRCTPQFDEFDCATMPSRKLVYLLHVRRSKAIKALTAYERLFDDSYLAGLPKTRRNLFRLYGEILPDGKADLNWDVVKHLVETRWRDIGGAAQVPALSTIRDSMKRFEERLSADRQKSSEKAGDAIR